MKFKYELDDSEGDIVDLQAQFCAASDPAENEKIVFRVGSDGQISILGNKEGWQYLTKICIEMAYCADKDPAYHIHKKKNMFDALKNGDEEVNFYIQEKP